MRQTRGEFSPRAGNPLTRYSRLPTSNLFDKAPCLV
jgi:hypothetical protein